jgi:coenzyme F420-0:L-glutamate ligase/coenzyme F420-1:gamma-L-glutamate ligase
MSQVVDLHEFIRTRQSIRRFTQDPVDPGALDRILETAMHAPSAHNRQPWRFAVITTRGEKSRLAEAMAVEFAIDLTADGIPDGEREAAVERSRMRIASAPVVIVLCMDLTDMDRYQDARRNLAERTMAVQSVANAGTTLLLAAHAEELGGVWICGPLFAQQAVTNALDLPASWEPQALLLIGMAASIPPRRSRRSLRDVAVFK